MTKLVSAGIIVKYRDRYLLGHVTGHDSYDIFKGRTEEGESYIQTALRECQEESGIEFTEDQLHYLGYHTYIPKKDLVLYVARIDELYISDLKCSTVFDNGKPEMDSYATFEFDDMIPYLGRNMGRVLSSLKHEIESY